MCSNIKRYHSQDYNFVFDTSNGFFMRWGKDAQDDPEYAPIGPEIMDIEVSTVCSQGCPWCYKSNKQCGDNMSFETFKKMFDKFPKTLTQIAFGVGDIDANKDLWKMMVYCRENNVVPNITINGYRMTHEYYDLLAKYCGAVAVSLYDDEDVCYDAVRELWAHGVKQVNIHCLLADETIDKCHHVLHMQKHDQRLANLNAVVFLWLKQRGERNTFHQVSYANYRKLVTNAILNENNIGFDSCSAPNFLAVIKDVFPDAYKQYELVAESCESTLFSYYINTHGRGYPCSFSEDGEGIDVVKCKDFVRDVWEHPMTKVFREKSLRNTCGNGCRKCQVYDLYIGEK